MKSDFDVQFEYVVREKGPGAGTSIKVEAALEIRSRPNQTIKEEKAIITRRGQSAVATA